jgi:hypothetical protein
VKIIKRTYGFCAKCGGTKDIDPNYVHGHCMYPHKKGGFHYCAVCGKPWGSLTGERDYVCMADLAKKPVA